MFPEWKVDSKFILGYLNKAFTLDAKLSSHAVEVDCPDANNINQVCDISSVFELAKTYILIKPLDFWRSILLQVRIRWIHLFFIICLLNCFTLTVLRMLSKHLGEDLFLKGVSLYLKKNLYGNSVTKDLWEGIGAATGVCRNRCSPWTHDIYTRILGIDIPKLMDNWVSRAWSLVVARSRFLMFNL